MAKKKPEKKAIESVSYDGSYPNLCCRKLVVKIKDYPKEVFDILPEILAVMNSNVEPGCCGGCL